MTNDDPVKRKQLKEAFIAGFMATGEGYNATCIKNGEPEEHAEKEFEWWVCDHKWGEIDRERARTGMAWRKCSQCGYSEYFQVGSDSMNEEEKMSDLAYEVTFDPMIELSERWGITIEEAEVFLEEVGYYDSDRYQALLAPSQ